MPGEAIQVGPFRGGLNTFSDESSIADNELVVCINFDPDIDGSLKSRPPAAEIGAAMPLQATGNPQLLASLRMNSGVELLIGTDGLSKTYYFNGTSWTLITSTIAASAATMFNGLVYLLAPPTSANPGGTWSLTQAFTPEPNMPKGGGIVGFKSRLWIVRGEAATTQGTRLFFSKVLGQADFWPVAPNFIEIGLGDGQNIVALSVYFGALILWRTDSIYRFGFTSDPAQGDVDVLVPGVGLQTKESLVAYESSFYFMYHGGAYEFINNRANQLNQIVTFSAVAGSDIVAPYAVSIIGQRVLFQWFDQTFVYHLRTQTWTVWSTTVFGGFGNWVLRPDSNGIAEAVCFSSKLIPGGGTRQARILSLRDEYVATRSESMRSIIQTKNYDYESATLIKRLFFWAVSAAWSGTLLATQNMINFTKLPTWGQIRAQHTWTSLRGTTWGALSSDVRKFDTTRPSVGSQPQRKEAKVGRSGRFKRINYRIEVANNGSSSTAPVRLFYLTTYVRAGQVIVKDVS